MLIHLVEAEPKSRNLGTFWGGKKEVAREGGESIRDALSTKVPL